LKSQTTKVLLKKSRDGRKLKPFLDPNSKPQKFFKKKYPEMEKQFDLS